MAVRKRSRLKERRLRERRRPHPLQAGGPRWDEDRRRAWQHVRAGALAALLLHVTAAGAFKVRLPWERWQPEPAREIRSHIVVLTPQRSRPLSLDPPVPVVEDAPEEVVEPTPPPARPPESDPDRARIVPVPTPEREDEAPEPDRSDRPDLVAEADTSETLSREVEVAGGGTGRLGIGVDGPIAEYAYYLEAVRDKIARYWTPPAGVATAGGEVASMVSFRIERDGTVSSRFVEEPSGKSRFDLAGLRAVDQANPFPPLPQDYRGDWLGIHLRFVYRD